MIDVYLAYNLYDEIIARRDSFPAKVTRTVTGVNGRHITVDSPVTGDLEFGVVEVTDQVSSAYGLFGVIQGVVSNQVTLDQRFIGSRRPAVGETVDIHGGPLSRCAAYYGTSPDIRAEVEAGREFFVTVEPRQGDRSFDTAFGRGLKGREGMKDTLGFRMVVETPWGEQGTVKESIHNYIELPLFMHQVLYLAFRVRAQEGEHVWIGGDASWVYQTFEREGIEGPLQGAIIEFDMKTR